MNILWLVRHWMAHGTDWTWYPPERFRRGRRCKVPLNRYLERFGRDRAPDEAFALRLMRGTGFGNGMTPGMEGTLSAVYVDAEYGFTLVRSLRWPFTEPVATVSFDLAEHEDGREAIVRQLQGVRGKVGVLRGLRWERMLLQIVTDWARANGCTHVACIQGKSSRWAHYDTFRSFRLRYDVSARRNGFTFDPVLGLWRLRLSP